MDRARAHDPGLGRRQVVGIAPATQRAACLPGVLAAVGSKDSVSSSVARLRVGVGGVRADGVEALERELGGNLGVVCDERLVGRLDDRELVLEALRVAEAEPAVAPLAADAFCPEVERLLGCDAPDHAMDHPAPARPGVACGYSKNVMSEPASPCSSA